MYLSELFLKALGEEESTLEALIRCDLELKERLHNNLDEQSVIDYFFCESEEISRKRYAELLDFLDVYNELDHEVRQEEKIKYDIEILNIIEEVEGCYQIIGCEKLTEQWSDKQKEALELLCREIAEISNGKYISFLKKVEQNWMKYGISSLKGFDESLIGFEYHSVKRRLIEAWIAKDLVIVVAGERGLTPQRLYGYRFDDIWNRLTSEEEEKFRDILLDSAY